MPNSVEPLDISENFRECSVSRNTACLAWGTEAGNAGRLLDFWASISRKRAAQRITLYQAKDRGWDPKGL